MALLVWNDDMSCHMKHRVFGLPRGAVAVEFAILIAFILPILVFGIIDFGRLIRARQVMTEVSRLGGGLVFSREKEYYKYRDIEITQEATALLDLLEDAGSSILKASDMDKWKIIVSKIKAAQQQGDSPMIVAQIERGNLPEYGILPDLPGNPPQTPQAVSQDALPYVYSHLDFPAADDPPDKSEIGVVEVFYKYVPITPLPNFIEGILGMDGGGVIIRSDKAFF